MQSNSAHWLLKHSALRDLQRIRGVSYKNAELLYEANIRSVREIASCEVAALCMQLGTINRQRRMVKRPPSPKQVAAWIAYAQELTLPPSQE